MLGSPLRPDASEAYHESKLAYLRSNALVGLLLSLAALGASLLAHLPPLGFVAIALALGVFVYLTWSRPALKLHLVWLVPVAVVGGVWLAAHLSHDMPKVLATAQFIAGLAVGMFGGFALERLRRPDRQ